MQLFATRRLQRSCLIVRNELIRQARCRRVMNRTDETNADQPPHRSMKLRTNTTQERHRNRDHNNSETNSPIGLWSVCSDQRRANFPDVSPLGYLESSFGNVAACANGDKQPSRFLLRSSDGETHPPELSPFEAAL